MRQRVDRVKEFYKDFAKDYDSSRYLSERQKRIDTAAKQAYSELAGKVAGKRHLDVGCGTGRIVSLMTRSGAISTGMDTAEEMLSIAKRKVKKARFKEGSVFSIPYSAGQFDLVTCSQVLTHLWEYEKPLREIKRVTKRNGTIIFDVRNLFYWKNFAYGLILALTPHRDYRPHFTTEKRIVDICDKLGLHVEGIIGQNDGRLHRQNRLCSPTLIFKARVP